MSRRTSAWMTAEAPLTRVAIGAASVWYHQRNANGLPVPPWRSASWAYTTPSYTMNAQVAPAPSQSQSGWANRMAEA